MSVHVRLDGFEELRQGLRTLPDDLVQSATTVVTDTATETGSDLVNHYPERSGNLRRGVKVTVASSRASVRAVVVSASPHAHLYEFGTGPRQTRSGANRGVMPPGPESSLMIPRAMRARRQMVDKLIAIVRAAGLTVTE